jgi:hypothetical protein
MAKEVFYTDMFVNLEFQFYNKKSLILSLTSRKDYEKKLMINLDEEDLEGLLIDLRKHLVTIKNNKSND